MFCAACAIPPVVGQLAGLEAFYHGQAVRLAHHEACGVHGIALAHVVNGAHGILTLAHIALASVAFHVKVGFCRLADLVKLKIAPAVGRGLIHAVAHIGRKHHATVLAHSRHGVPLHTHSAEQVVEHTALGSQRCVFAHIGTDVQGLAFAMRVGCGHVPCGRASRCHGVVDKRQLFSGFAAAECLYHVSVAAHAHRHGIRGRKGCAVKSCFWSLEANSGRESCRCVSHSLAVGNGCWRENRHALVNAYVVELHVIFVSLAARVESDVDYLITIRLQLA